MAILSRCTTTGWRSIAEVKTVWLFFLDHPLGADPFSGSPAAAAHGLID